MGKKKDKFGTTLFKSWDAFAKNTSDKMDKGWELPQPTEMEDYLIFKLARDQLVEILVENDDAPKGKGKGVKLLNEMYQLLFKLNTLVDDDDVEEEEPKENDKTSYKV